MTHQPEPITDVRHLLYLLVLAGLASFGSQGRTQGMTQLACRVVVERDDGTVSVYALAQADQPVTVDYVLSTTKISASGTGTTEQSGTRDMQVGKTQILSQVAYRLEPDGWLEFELEVSDRLTGAKCEASEAVSPI